MDPFSIDRAITEHVPDEWLRSVVKMIFLAKKLTYDHCRAEFSAKAATNVSTYYCRGKVQDLLFDSAALVPGFEASFIDASGWKHVEIMVGPLTMTAHLVDYPCAMVDPAEYRRSLAESQPSLYGPADMIPDAKLYGLFVYGPYRGRDRHDAAQYAYLPGSIYLAFPEAAMKRYAHRINLFERFPNLIESLLPKEWDKEARLIFKWQARQTRTA